MELRVTQIDPEYFVAERSDGLFAQIMFQSPGIWYIQAQGAADIEPVSFDDHESAIEYVSSMPVPCT